MNLKRLLPGLALAAAVSTVAYAAVLKTDPAKSAVSVTFKQMNVPVDAKFKKFSAQIDYDAAKPANSKPASISTSQASTWATRSTTRKS